MTTARILATAALVVSHSVIASGAEPLPLSRQYWQDPSFLRSFNGSYRIEARIEPAVSTEERGLLVKVQKEMAAGDRDDALELIRDSSLLSESAALQFNLGNLLFEEGELEDAAAAYQEAIELYPSFRRAHRNLAMALMRTGEREDALSHLLEAIRLGDQDGATFGLLGYARLDERKWASALQAYRMALLTEPDSVEWKAGLAQCLQHLDQNEEAVALLDEVIAARPAEQSYALLQAGLLMALNRNTEAVEVLELPRRLGTLDADGLLLLAELHLRANRETLARDVVEKALETTPPPSPIRLLDTLRSAVNLKAWPLARTLEAAAQAGVDDSESPLATALSRERARIALGSGKETEQGLEILRGLIAENPLDGQALLILGRYLGNHNEAEEGEMLLERAVRDEETAYDAWSELARLRAALGRYGAAVEAADQALELRYSDEFQAYRDALQSLQEAGR